jgi:hypothetical protein
MSRDIRATSADIKGGARMFPIAHAWLLERLVAEPEAAHNLGCVWPDMLFGSPLTHQQSHREGERLVALAETLPAEAGREEFRAFVVGALSHGAEPHGFDWYSDEAYGGKPAEERGYAFQRGKSLAEEAARACGLPSAQGWWKAHNLIEQAFEPALYAAQPHLGERLEAACADAALAGRVAAILAPHFGVAATALADAMARFSAVVALRPVDDTTLAGVYAHQVQLKHGTEADVPALTRLLARARELIAVDQQLFLDTCVERVGAMLVETATWR